MEILILGDFNFALNIIQGVTRLYNSGSPFVTYAPAILITLFLLWSTLKWALDQQKAPFPAKEFVFGLVFWLIFGGGDLSPKFQVELVSEREARFRVIDDVPLLVAAPSWLASNFFGGIRKEMESNFTPIYYSIGDRTPDPLAALVKMYGHSNISYVDHNLSQTIKTYMIDCYDKYIKLDSVTAIPNPPKLVNKTPIYNGLWESVKVDYNFITTTYYDEVNPEGVIKTCPWVYNKVASVVNSATGPFANKLEDYTEARGITLQAIEGATDLIFSSGVDAPSNPYSVQTGLFLSMAMRDGITQGGLKIWGDKMVFEAHRKRVFEKAGERNIFLMVMIPVITAVENFSFFIAPLMMLLAVMGGTGLAFIGKYLMLVLFVNLWGFVKVFTDLFTALSVEKAFDTASIVNPFAFGAYPETFAEIEGLLATSANLTTAIPMLVMFLLYGGIHSVMGVMNGLTKGSVDGQNMSPRLTSSMNDGRLSGGDQVAQYVPQAKVWATGQDNIRDHATPKISVNNHTGNAVAASHQITDIEASGHAKSAATKIMDAVTSTDVSQHVTNGQVTSNFNTLSGIDQLAIISQALEEQKMDATAERLAAIAEIGAKGEGGFALGGNITRGERTSGDSNGSNSRSTAGGSFGLNFGLSAAAALKANGGIVDEKTYAEMSKFLQNFGEKVNRSTQAGTSGSSGETVSDADLAQRSDTLQKINQDLENYSKSVERKSAIAQSTSGLNSLDTSFDIRTAVLNSSYQGKWAEFEQMYNQLWKNSEGRMKDLKLPQTAAEFLVSENAKGNLLNGVLELDRTFAKNKDENGFDSLKEQQKDLSLASQMWRQVGIDSGVDDVKAGTGKIADSYDVTSKAISFDANDLNNKSTAPKKNIYTTEQMDTAATNINTDADKTENKVESKKGLFEVIAGSINSAVADEWGKINYETPVNLSHSDEDYKNAMKGYHNRSPIHATWNGFADFAMGAAQGVGDFAGFFGKSGRLWGVDADERAAVFASQAHANGVYSNRLAEGFEALSRLDQSQINNLYKNGELSETAYAMNDVYRALPKLMEDVQNHLGDTEEAKRYASAVNNFKAFKDSLPQDLQGRLDVISDQRNKGAMPDVVADELINNKSGQQLDEVKAAKFASPDNSPASVFINANPELLDSKAIRDMSGFDTRDDIDMDDKHFRESRAELGEGILSSTADHLKKSNDYEFDGDKFVKGSNAQIDNRVILGRLKELAGGSLSDNQYASHRYGASQAYGLTTGGLALMMKNLEAAGFKNTQQAMDYSEVALSLAMVQGLVSDKSTSEQNVEGLRQYLATGDSEFLARGAYKPLREEAMNAPVLLERGFKDGAAFATAERTARSSDNRVVFASEVAVARNLHARDTEERLDAQVKQTAISGATFALKGYDAYDQVMNRRFNEVNVGEEPPKSFKTDAGAEFTYQGKNEDGKSIYSDGKGTFTYDQGDDRLMPLDHPHYKTK